MHGSHAVSMLGSKLLGNPVARSEMLSVTLTVPGRNATTAPESTSRSSGKKFLEELPKPNEHSGYI